MGILMNIKMVKIMGTLNNPNDVLGLRPQISERVCTVTQELFSIFKIKLLISDCV